LIKFLQSALKRIFQAIYAFFAANKLDPLPILGDARQYTPKKFSADLQAGINVALLAIPQGMAYAVIAEVPIYYGITGSAVAAFIAALFSGSRHTNLGPTNATAFMVFSFFALVPNPETKVAIMPAVVFLVGILLVIGAYFRVADLIQYVSRSVIVGYITGAAVLIIVNQVRHVTGIEFPTGEDTLRTFFGILSHLVSHLHQTRPEPLLLGLATAGLYLYLSKVLGKLPVFAITLAIATIVSFLMSLAGLHLEYFTPFSLSDLHPVIPKFSERGIIEDVSQLFSLAFSIAFLAALENSVMSKTLASRSGDRPDANQDMLGTGISNLVTSFFSTMPSSGSLTRSQLNFASGAETRFSSIFSAIFCALGAVLLAWTAIIAHIPKAALAALVICISVSLINTHNIRVCLGATSADATVLIVTLLSTLILPLHTAIFMGVAISVMLYLHQASRPELVEYDFTPEGELTESEAGHRTNPLISIVHVEGELFFGAAELFRSQIQRTCSDPNLRVIVLRMRNARRLDATSVIALEELVKFMHSAQRHLIISGATAKVAKVLTRSGAIEVIGKENIFRNDPQRPNLSTREALKRAQDLLGTKQADVQIFVESEAKKGDSNGDD